MTNKKKYQLKIYSHWGDVRGGVQMKSNSLAPVQSCPHKPESRIIDFQVTLKCLIDGQGWFLQGNLLMPPSMLRLPVYLISHFTYRLNALPGSSFIKSPCLLHTEKNNSPTPPRFLSAPLPPPYEAHKAGQANKLCLMLHVFLGLLV